LGELLLNAVRRQMVADVPVGVLLSGGVDSSLMTAMAASISSKPVKTFTIAFPGHGRINEAPFARIVANHFGTDHTELPAPEVDPDILPMLMRQYDEPIADSSMIPTYLVSRLIRQHATVALGGDGGDELFGGYPSYVRAIRMEQAQRMVPRFMRRPVSTFARHLPVTIRGRNLLMAIGEDGIPSLQHLGVYFGAEWRRLLLPDSPSTFNPEQYRLSLASGAKTVLQAVQRMDFRSYMVDDILVKVDRASMLNSLEVRAPFLDPFVIEFAFGRIPDELKTTSTERKILLRRLASRVLPPELELRRKQGFSIPIRKWLTGSWRSFVHDVLAGSELFSREAIQALFAAQDKSGMHSPRIFALMAFELWRREYRVTL
jgi:asparagine synthase (glutamine-hydrolysing)